MAKQKVEEFCVGERVKFVESPDGEAQFGIIMHRQVDVSFGNSFLCAYVQKGDDNEPSVEEFWTGVEDMEHAPLE